MGKKAIKRWWHLITSLKVNEMALIGVIPCLIILGYFSDNLLLPFVAIVAATRLGRSLKERSLIYSNEKMQTLLRHFCDQEEDDLDYYTEVIELRYKEFKSHKEFVVYLHLNNKLLYNIYRKEVPSVDGLTALQEKKYKSNGVKAVAKEIIKQWKVNGYCLD